MDHFLRLDLIDEAGLRGGCQRSDSVGPAISVLSADGIDLYKQRYEVRGFDDSRTTMNYLQIPVGIDYTVALGERFALIPHAGFYYAVGVGGKRKVGAEEIPVFGEKAGFRVTTWAFRAEPILRSVGSGSGSLTRSA